jgi:hypothetical protein
MTDKTYAYNSLTNFEYEGFTVTGNGNRVTAETCLEKFVK